MNRTPINLILADDHALFRQGLKSLLALQPDISVVGEVESAAALDDLMKYTSCDIVLLDLQMGRWLLDDIPRLAESASVIVLTANEAPETGVRAIQLGARAFVQKRLAIETLMIAIRTVAEGLVWMPPIVQAEFASQIAANRTPLTGREYEIVRLVAAGRRNAEVAQFLDITEATVKSHLNNIFQKLGLRDRLELTRYAIRTGAVDVLDPAR